MTHQPTLFASEADGSTTTKKMRVFADDEIASALVHLPKAAEYESFEDYKKYLAENLPYNAAATRRRRAQYILNRFFPEDKLDTPLQFFISKNRSSDALKQVIFYQLTLAEPVLGKIADELIYPALPIGKVTREQIIESMLSYLPEIEPASQAKVLRSIFHSYDLLGIGREEDSHIKFQLKSGMLEALAYVLVAEFPEPGIFSFDRIFNGPAHHQLLWDKEWIRKQLYILRDMGVVSKVSEIDTVRQFSLEYGQRESLERFFAAL